MIRFRHKKTGKFYALLAHGVDATNQRDGTPVVVYSPEDDPHAIYVREREEFYEKFEEFKDRPPCYECGKPSIHDHHVIPRSLGGTKTIPLCGKCHAIIHKTAGLVDSSMLTKMALAKKKQNGERIGAVEYGYKLAEDGVMLEVCDEEQSVIRVAKKLHEEGHSLGSVAKQLASSGIMSRVGKPFVAQQIKNMILKKVV